MGCTDEVVLSGNTAPALAVTPTSTTTTTTINKNIFSQWDQDSFPSKRLPFTGKVYNSASGDTIFLMDTGTQCICTMLFVPNPGGTITFSSCSGTGCAGVQDTYTWSNINGSLTMCRYFSPSDCSSYR